jgi:hypothetical protein
MHEWLDEVVGKYVSMKRLDEAGVRLGRMMHHLHDEVHAG